MDALFDHDGIGVASNPGGIGHGQPFSCGTRGDALQEAASIRSTDRPYLPHGVQLELQRLSVQRARLRFLPRLICVPKAPNTGGPVQVSHDNRLSASRAQEQVDVGEADRAPVHPVACSAFDASRDEHAAVNDPQVRFPNALPPAPRRVAVHGVKRKADAAAAECYGVFLYDTAGREHALEQFDDAASAAYAALRYGQMYRVGVEFGNFSDPKALRALSD